MSKHGPVQSERLTFPGPVGPLEAILERPRDVDPLATVVVCHPHPQHGGTLHNKVTHTLARAFVDQAYAALRFNFRGTEASQGDYDAGVGEVDDVLAAAGYLAARFIDLPQWLAGFSFGAAMAIKAAQRQSFAGLVSVAPAVERFAVDASSPPGCPWLMVQGNVDELVDVDATLTWCSTLEPGPELVVLDGVGHFFHGRLIELRALVSEFVTAHDIAAKKSRA